MIAFPTADGDSFDPVAEARLVATEREHCAWCEDMICVGESYWRVDVTPDLRRLYHEECYLVADFGAEYPHTHVRGSCLKLQPIRKAAA